MLCRSLCRPVLLNSLAFSKDQKVSITGQVQNSDQLYKLEESLNKQKDVSDATITNRALISAKSSGGPPGRPPSGGARGKGGITFTITFDYKNFTKKSARAKI